MRRAWAIFRQTYNYPAIPFRRIGRSCFAWALRQAWQEAKQAEAAAAIPAAVKADTAVRLNRELDLLEYRADYRTACLRRAEIQAELARLAA
jgi:hypothetical protein